MLLFDDSYYGTRHVSDGSGLAEALLGLPGFRVLQVSEIEAELVVVVESRATVAGRLGCGVQAEVHDLICRDTAAGLKARACAPCLEDQSRKAELLFDVTLFRG